MMKLRYRNSFVNMILNAIEGMSDSVVLRSELKELGSARQLSRALKALVEDGKLIKFGYGIYVKAEKTPYGDEPVMAIPIAQACTEALDKLGIKWQLGQAIKDYNAGKTQQVPAQFIIRLKNRFRGKLGTKNRTIRFEGEVNAH